MKRNNTVKTIIDIARVELATMFCSPVAWLVLVVFGFQVGLGFLEKLEFYETRQATGAKLEDLTAIIFNSFFGVLADVQAKLFYFVPLLTMGLLSREIASGSIKLLLSSPVKIREIVLGKFLSIIVYGLLLMFILVVYMVAALIAIPGLDIGFYLTGVLGLYLLFCSYAAIGLFMSSLTSYQVVAAISTLVVLATLNYIGKLWQNYDLVRDFTYWLSIAGRADSFISGLITSRDLVYFLLIMLLFISFTSIRLRAGRESRGWQVKTARYLAVFFAVVVIGYLSSKPSLVAYADTSATERNTISPTSRAILQKLGKPLEVTTYVNLLDQDFHAFMPSQRIADRSRLELYQRFLPDMKISYVNYYDTSSAYWLFDGNKGVQETAEKIAKAYKMPLDYFEKPHEIRKKINLEPEDFRTVRQLKVGGQSSFVRATFDDLERFAGEAEVAASLRKLVEPQVKVMYVTGHGERAIDKMGDRDVKTQVSAPRFRHSLTNQGFDVSGISLESAEIPEGIAALVIADPLTPLTPAALSKLQHYIDQGGNLMVYAELNKEDRIKPLLDMLGVRMIPAAILETSKDYPPEVVLASLSDNVESFMPDLQKNRERKVKIYLSGAAGLEQYATGPFTAKPVITADTVATWLRPGVRDMHDSTVAVYTPHLGDRKQQVNTMLALTRRVKNKDQRIIVSGDADLFGNTIVFRNGNFKLGIELFRWLSEGRSPVDTRKPPFKDNEIVASQSGIKAMNYIFLGLIPLLVIAAGAIFLIRRQRR